MTAVTRVLQVEDSESDAVLQIRLLTKAGFEVQCDRVETAPQMRAAIARQSWDVIISDHHMPHFDAPSALRILQETGKDIPFIVVSGAIGEEVAVEMMRSGAHDYLLKDRLSRLAAAVDREIRAAHTREQRRRAEEERSAAFSELAAVNSNAPVSLMVVNSEYRVEKVNNRAAELSGRPAHELTGASYGEVIQCLQALNDPAGCGSGPNCKECIFRRAVVDTLVNGTKYESVEFWVPSVRDTRCLLFSTTPLVLGHNRKALICAQDITPMKRAEKSLRDTIEKLELALNEKAVLFQELHQRVKNNLQVIASLLSMQSRMLEDRTVVEKLKETEQRVKAMAMIHEQLYSQREISSVDLADYMRKLASHLLAVHERSDSISLRLDLTPATLAIERAIPCGLILNEVITRLLKSAYPSGHGEIVLRLWSDLHNVRIHVSNPGADLPPNSVWGDSKSLAMTIVRALAKQLDAELQIAQPPGIGLTLRIPKETQESVMPQGYRSNTRESV